MESGNSHDVLPERLEQCVFLIPGIYKDLCYFYVMIEIFKAQKQWKQFEERYKNQKAPEVMVVDEAIWPFIICALGQVSGLPIIIITSTFERAEQLKKEIRCLLTDAAISLYTGMGRSIFFKNKNPDYQAIVNRLDTIRKIAENQFSEKIVNNQHFIIATASSLTNLVPSSRIRDLDILRIKKGIEYRRESITGWLIENGYERVNQVYDRGEFSVKGDIIDIFDITRTYPVRVDLLIDEVEKITSYDIASRINIDTMDHVAVFPNINLWKVEPRETSGKNMDMLNLFDIIEIFLSEFITVLCDPLEVYLKLKSDMDMTRKLFDRELDKLITEDKDVLSKYLIDENFFDNKDYGQRLDLISNTANLMSLRTFIFNTVSRQKRSMGNANIFVNNIKKDIRSGKKIIISTDSKSRMKKITDLLFEKDISYEMMAKNFFTLKENHIQLKPGIVNITENRLFRGFNSKKLSIYGELDIYQQMEPAVTGTDITARREFQYFKPGDYIVHKSHGIGIYIDTISKEIDGYKREYFLIEYGKGDKLYIPTWQADRLNKYIGSKKPVIAPLDSRYWDSIQKKVRKSVKKLAVDLSKLYAERQAAIGYAFPPDSSWQSEIEDIFPFKETRDQVRAIDYVKKAMEAPKPMDVLVIGDVGFGKTEVAIRAAFKAMEDGKQVLMLVPTTILADQHYLTFSGRFKDYPVNIEVLSRFKKTKEQERIVEDFSLGRVDMLIGTHRILQKDIKPRDLGLIIIDEEQRFGVNSKEKIKLLKTQVDVLTLSATPIPRTLYMTLAGIREMALIETYPEGRNPIETFVGEMGYEIVKNSVEREVARGGQVYYVYNRISGIEQKLNQLSKLLQGARIALTHGQMEGKKIERLMNDFINKKYDVLLTTSIIESGMDIENVNTLIVENSHMFGLSQLYQLRGRVGRSSEQAYAYFFYPGKRTLSETAYKRLRTLTDYTDLGSGYEVAMKDLEIRGAGELLGARQHGHINSVGYDMYCQIIKEEVDKLKGKEVPQDINIQIDLPVSAYIPKNYINSQRERIRIYRELGSAENFEKIDLITDEMVEKYGELSGAVYNLIGFSRIKSLMNKGRIESIRFSKERGIILKKVILGEEKAARLLASNKNIFYQPRYGQVIIKNIDKKINLDLVIKQVNDIIMAM